MSQKDLKEDNIERDYFRPPSRQLTNPRPLTPTLPRTTQPEIVEEKRYFGGRLTKMQYQWSLIMLTFLTCVIGLLLYAYFIWLPEFIKTQFWDYLFVGSFRSIFVDEFNLIRFTENGLVAKLVMHSLNLKLMFSFLDARFQPSTYTMYSKDTRRHLATLKLNDPLTICGWAPMNFYLDPFEIEFEDLENTRSVLSGFSDYLFGNNGTDNSFDPVIEVYFEAHTDVYVAGLLVKNVNMYRDQLFDVRVLYNWLGDQLFGGYSKLLDTDFYQNLDAIGEYPLRQIDTSAQDAVDPFMLETINVKADSKAVVVDVKGEFKVDQPSTLNISMISTQIKLNQNIIAEIRLTGLSLVRNQKKFDIDIDVEPMIRGDPQDIKKAILNIASGNAANVTAGFNQISIWGDNQQPIGWLNTILHGIDIDLDVESFRKQFFVMTHPSTVAKSFAKTLGFHGLDVKVEPDGSIKIRPQFSLPETSIVNIIIDGFHGQAMNSAGKPFCEFLVHPIRILHEDSTFKAPEMHVKFLETPEAIEVGSEVLRESLPPSAGNTFVVLGDIRFSGNEDRSSGMNLVFQVAALQIPLNVLIGGQNIFKPVPIISLTPSPNFANLMVEEPAVSLPKKEKVESPQPLFDLELIHAKLEVDDQGLFIGVHVAMINDYPFYIQIPYLDLDVGLDDAHLINLQISGLSVVRGESKAHLKIRLNLLGGLKGAQYIQDVIQYAMTGTGPEHEFMLKAIRFGSNKHKVQTFSKLEKGWPASLIMSAIPLLLSSDNSNATVVQPVPGRKAARPSFQFNIRGVENINSFDWLSLLPKFHAFGVSTTGSSLVLSTDMHISNRLPLEVGIGHARLSVGIKHHRFVTASLGGLRMNPGLNKIPLKVALNFHDSPQNQALMESLVNDLMTYNLLPILTLSELSFGSSSSGSVKLLSYIKWPISLNSTSSSSFDIGSLIPMARHLSVLDLIPQVHKLNFETQENAHLFLSTSLRLAKALPVSINIPYISVGIQSKNQGLMNIELQNVYLSRGSMEPKLSISINNHPAAVEIFSESMNAILSGHLPPYPFAISGFKIGESRKSHIGLFEKVKIPIAQLMLRPSGVSRTKTPSISIHYVLPWIAGLTIDDFDPKILRADIKSSVSGLTISASVSFNNPMPITGRIGVLGATLGVDSSSSSSVVALQTANLALKRGRQQRSFKIQLQFSDHSDIPSKVQHVFEKFFSQQRVYIYLSRVRLGYSAGDQIESLRRMKIPIPLLYADTAIPIIRSSLGSVPEIGPRNLGSDLFKIETVDDGIKVSLNSAVKIPFPLTIKMDYLSTSIHVGQSSYAAKAYVTDVKLVDGHLSAKIKLSFGRDPALENRIANLVDRIRAKNPVEIGIKGFAFGPKLDYQPFSKAMIPIRISPNFFKEENRSSYQMPNITIDTIKINTKSSGFDGTIKLKMAGIKLPINLKIGYLSTVAEIDHMEFAKIKVWSTQLSGKNGNYNIGSQCAIRFKHHDMDLEERLAQIVYSFFNKTSTKFYIGIRSLVFGHSKETAFTLFQKAHIDIQINPQKVEKLRPRKNKTIQRPPDSGKKPFRSEMGLNLTEIHLKTDKDFMSGSIKGSLNEIFLQTDLPDIRIEIGHIEVTAAVDGSDIITASAGPFMIEFCGKNVGFDIPMRLQFYSTDEGTRKVAKLVNRIMKGATENIKLADFVIRGFKIGEDDKSAFRLFQKVEVPIPIPKRRIALLNTNQTVNQGLRSSLRYLIADAVKWTNVTLKTNENSISGLVGVKLENIFKNSPLVNITLGHLSLSPVVYGSEIASVSIDKFTMQIVDSSLHLILPMEVFFSRGRQENVGKKISKLIARLMKGRILEKDELAIRGIRFGESMERSTSLFRKISIPLRHPSAERIVNHTFKSEESEVGPVDLSSYFSFGGAHLEFSGKKMIGRLILNMPKVAYQILIKIGYLTAGFRLEEDKILSVTTRHIVYDNKQRKLEIPVVIEFEDNDNSAETLSRVLNPIFRDLLSKKPIQTDLYASIVDLGIGLRPDVVYEEFENVVIPLKIPLKIPSQHSLPIKHRLAPRHVLQSPIKFLGGDIEVVPDGVEAKFTWKTRESTPLKIKVPYFTAMVKSNKSGAKLAQAFIDISQPMGHESIIPLRASLKISPIKELSEFFEEALLSVVNDGVISTRAIVSGLEMGESAENAIRLFSKLSVSLNNITLPSPSNLPSIPIGNLPFTFDDWSIKKIWPPMVNLQFTYLGNVNVSVGDLSFTSQLNQTSMFGVILNSAVLKQGQNNVQAGLKFKSICQFWKLIKFFFDKNKLYHTYGFKHFNVKTPSGEAVRWINDGFDDYTFILNKIKRIPWSSNMYQFMMELQNSLKDKEGIEQCKSVT